jgi:hypothetical protein
MIYLGAVSKDEVWVGNSAGLLHWEKGKWKKVKTPADIYLNLQYQYYFSDMFIESSSSVWFPVRLVKDSIACNDLKDQNCNLNLLLHWNGNSFQKFPLHPAMVNQDPLIPSIFILSKINIYFSPWWHWDGTRWTNTDFELPGKFWSWLNKSPEKIWVMMETPNDPNPIRLYHWNSKSWDSKKILANIDMTQDEATLLWMDTDQNGWLKTKPVMTGGKFTEKLIRVEGDSYTTIPMPAPDMEFNLCPVDNHSWLVFGNDHQDSDYYNYFLHEN